MKAKHSKKRIVRSKHPKKKSLHQKFQDMDDNLNKRFKEIDEGYQ